MAEEIALAHHERWDGKGYPYGLAGEAIPLNARIVAVADVLDALTHTRPYKRPWSVDEALSEIGRQSGYHFDPRVVGACFLAFGPGGKLSPTDVPEGWETTAQIIEHVPLVPNQQPRSEASFSNPTERLEKMLIEKTRELETSRREAQAASQRLQEMAFTDTLTGLHNRRAFEADLEAEVARALHHGDHLTVLNLDLDHLKVVNDSEGHERGDALLRAFARVLSGQLQDRGKLYRVGGDEFAAILIHTRTEHVMAVRAQIDRAVQEVRFLGFPNASVSVGFVAFPDEAGAPGDLVRLGDQRMYDDKLRGRQERQQKPLSEKTSCAA